MEHYLADAVRMNIMEVFQKESVDGEKYRRILANGNSLE